MAKDDAEEENDSSLTRVDNCGDVIEQPQRSCLFRIDVVVEDNMGVSFLLLMHGGQALGSEDNLTLLDDLVAVTLQAVPLQKNSEEDG